jgi:hypothetical protein
MCYHHDGSLGVFVRTRHRNGLGTSFSGTTCAVDLSTSIAISSAPHHTRRWMCIAPPIDLHLRANMPGERR